MINVGEILLKLWNESGFAAVSANFMDGGWQNLVMIAIACVLLYLGIVKKFEPLLLVGIAFGCLLSNLPNGNLYHPELWDSFMAGKIGFGTIMHDGGLLDIFYIGVKAGIYPCLIFMGVGAMTDFGPLLSNPKSLLLGAAAQMGVFAAFFGATLLGFTAAEAASIGIIGGADGPTAILTTTRLAPRLLGAIAIAAYSYMALIPLIQPPFMRMLTTPKERQIKMVQTRTVSKTEKIIFPIVVTIFVVMLLPDTAPLIGCLMLGNLFKECGVTDRLSDTVQNALMNIVTILLSTAVGATMVGVDSWQGEPPHRFRRCVRRTYGSPCFQRGRPEGQPLQLPADARHGPQRGRCHRLCHRRRLPAEGLWRISKFMKNGPGFTGAVLLYSEGNAFPWRGRWHGP